MDNIRRGDRAMDRVTGFTGIVVSRVDFATGNVQFVLQDKAREDGKIPDGETFDHHTLELLQGGVNKAIEPELNAKALLGKKLRCLATGFEGIAVRATTFLNGCIYYTLVGKANAKGEYAELFLDSMRAEVVSAGIQKKIQSIQKAAGKNTGGPVFRNPARG